MRCALIISTTLILLAGCGGGEGREPRPVPDQARAPLPLPAAEREAEALARRPNIVFVLTDDLSAELIAHLPSVQQLQRDGTRFSRYIVSDSLCCPSRASILTGKLPHNHGVYGNVQPEGGAVGFRTRGNSFQTFAGPLLLRGYRTALLGKYLNGYSRNAGVPPGWTDWAGSGKAYRGYHYGLSINGSPVQYGGRPEDYVTDVLAARARSFVAKTGAVRRPFFLQVSTFVPHPPATPAPRDRASAAGMRAPRGPAFNRPNRGAPSWLVRRSPLTARQRRHIDALHRRRVASLGAVDDLITSLRSGIARLGLDGSTYFVFSSDNGFHMGEHRLTPGKKTAFDSDIRVPLVIAGPGVPAGRTVDALAQNTDLAPTFTDLAGARSLPSADGRSLVPLLRGGVPGDWRTAALIEHRRTDQSLTDPDRQPPSSGKPPSYEALRLRQATYVEYGTGEREYYDLRRDPAQRVNRYGQLSPCRQGELHRRLDALRRCTGPRQCATDRAD